MLMHGGKPYIAYIDRTPKEEVPDFCSLVLALTGVCGNDFV